MSPLAPLAPLLYVTGVFALVLGGLHFFFPMVMNHFASCWT
jgi:hypothetical protein